MEMQRTQNSQHNFKNKELDFKIYLESYLIKLLQSILLLTLIIDKQINGMEENSP